LKPIDLSLPRIKCIGAQWLVRLYEYLGNTPSLIINGFNAAGIPQSIDAGRPIMDKIGNDDESNNESDDESYGSSCSSDGIIQCRQKEFRHLINLH
jgi:hypothetical protein